MQENQQGNWAYRNEDQVPQATHFQTPPSDYQTSQEPVSWTASEFIAHHKDTGWYAMVAGSFFMFAVVIYLVTRDLMSVIFISIVVILFMIISAKKPQQRRYSVDSHGISIDEKFYPYSLFKSFAVMTEGAFDSIVFMPLKRFMPELTIYFAPDDESRILNTLAANLPNEQRKERSVDQLMKRLRF